MSGWNTMYSYHQCKFWFTTYYTFHLWAWKNLGKMKFLHWGFVRRRYTWLKWKIRNRKYAGSTEWGLPFYFLCCFEVAWPIGLGDVTLLVGSTTLLLLTKKKGQNRGWLQGKQSMCISISVAGCGCDKHSWHHSKVLSALKEIWLLVPHPPTPPKKKNCGDQNSRPVFFCGCEHAGIVLCGHASMKQSFSCLGGLNISTVHDHTCATKC